MVLGTPSPLTTPPWLTTSWAAVVFGDSMNIENLTIKGTGFRTDCGSGVEGHRLRQRRRHGEQRKGGRHHPAQWLATTGLGIWVKGQNVPHTVTITNTMVSDYQKSALVTKAR